jgi:hypothetical protein
MRLPLVVITVFWSLGLLAFLLVNPVVRGEGEPTPPEVVHSR